MKLILPDHLAPVLGDRVCQIAPECELVVLDSQGNVHGDLDDSEVLFLRWGVDRSTYRDLIGSLASNLRWIHTVSAGVDHVLVPELEEINTLLSNASGVFTVPIAEMVLGYMLTVVKRIPELLEQQHGHHWRKLDLDELRGKTVGILGLGDIGGEVARLCRAFGMRVVGVRRSGQEHESADEIFTPDRLPEFLACSDFIVLATPLTPETRGMIGRAELEAMKPSAWLINVSRGHVIDEDALLESLREKRIGGACLDVFVEEPLPVDSPFWELPNVIITPHNSWSSPRMSDREAELFLENLRRYVNGDELLNVVDTQAGY
jgi:phosphoglycerate dehydrogenase-like enzyme